MLSYLIISCPHCQHSVQLFQRDFKCKIYRHGVYKDTYQQIPPHLHKEECDRLVQENLIYGCGKPFQLISKQENNVTYWSAIKCGYI